MKAELGLGSAVLTCRLRLRDFRRHLLEAQDPHVELALEPKGQPKGRCWRFTHSLPEFLEFILFGFGCHLSGKQEVWLLFGQFI